jgi:diacylglycerol kinase family enzyme
LEILFAQFGVSSDFLPSSDGNSITQVAARAVNKGYDVVVAGGGDGTVNAVASALVGTSTPLGILPMGTLNHFAKDLKVPIDMEAAVKTIVSGRVKLVDVGEVNGRFFINNSSLGLYPSIVRLREAIQKSGYQKWPAFVRAVWTIFSKFPRLRLELKSVTAPISRTVTPLLFIGNNPYETTLTQLGGRTALDQGKLWVVVPTAETRWQLVGALFTLVRGRSVASDVSAFEAANLVVNNKRRALNIAVDGEVLLLEPPLHYRIRPKALKVIVPSETLQ